MKELLWENFPNFRKAIEEASKEQLEEIEIFREELLSLKELEKKVQKEKKWNSMFFINGLWLDSQNPFISCQRYRYYDYDSDFEKTDQYTYDIQIGHIKRVHLNIDDEVSFIYNENSVRSFVFIDGKGFFYATRKKRTIPLPLSVFAKFFGSYTTGTHACNIFQALLEDIKEFSYCGKDLVREFETNPSLIENTPYSLNDYLMHDNKVDFVRNKEGLVSENDIKRFPTLYASFLRQAKKAIMPRDFSKFRNYLKVILNDKYYNHYKPSDFASLLTSYYTNKGDSYSYYTTLDFIEMMLDLKKPISLSLSPKAIANKHDSIMAEHRKFKAEKLTKEGKNDIKIPRKYAGVKNIPGFKVLDKVSDFIEEGQDQNNCVASYADRVSKGECLVLSGEIEGIHYTVEVRLDKDNQFKIWQMRENRNKPASAEHIRIFQEYLKKPNKRRKVVIVPKEELFEELIDEKGKVRMYY